MHKNPARPLAPHVQAAISAAAQPKTAEVGGGGRTVAAHVQAAIGAAAQPKTAEVGSGGRTVAAHVQAAIAAAVQARPQPPADRERAAHVRQTVAAAQAKADVGVGSVERHRAVGRSDSIVPRTTTGYPLQPAAWLRSKMGKKEKVKYEQVPSDAPEREIGSLMAGDILVKHFAGGVTGTVISVGESAAGGSGRFVHAAIYVGGGVVVEASGGGVAQNPLEPLLKTYTYEVFRCGDPDARSHACDHALMQVDKSYATVGAARSLIGGTSKADDEVGLLGEIDYFCSQLAADCYRDILKEEGDPTSFSPDRLFELLERHTAFTYIGAIGIGA